MLFLYHATDKQNMRSILENGLLCNPPKRNWDGMTTNLWDDFVFLALDANTAEAYAESQDDAPDEIVILKVALEDLDEDRIGYDWMNRCEYHKDINSIVYQGDVGANLLKPCNVNEEPFQDIDTFEGTWLYDRVMTVFKEEVETNMEN